MLKTQAKEFVNLLSSLIETRLSDKNKSGELFMEVASIEDEIVKLLSTNVVTPVSQNEVAHTRKPESLACPECGGVMVSRTNRSEGTKFWGCKDYPDCLGTRDSEGNPKGHKARDGEGRTPAPGRWNVR